MATFTEGVVLAAVVLAASNLHGCSPDCKKEYKLFTERFGQAAAGKNCMTIADTLDETMRKKGVCACACKDYAENVEEQCPGDRPQESLLLMGCSVNALKRRYESGLEVSMLQSGVRLDGIAIVPNCSDAFQNISMASGCTCGA